MPRRRATTAERRDRDREIRRLSANREIGRRHPYATLLGADWLIPRVLGFIVLSIGAAWTWFHVDHKLIGFVAAAAGIMMVLAYAGNLVGTSGLQAKQMALATGRRIRPLWWHGVGAAGAVLLVLAWVAVPR